MDLTDIVHPGEQPPLDIHLGLGAQGETIQPFLNTEIGEGRLDDGQSPGIDLPALGCVYPGFHFVDQVGLFSIRPGRQVAPGCA